MEDGLGNAVFSPDDHGALLAMTTWFLACALVRPKILPSAYSELTAPGSLHHSTGWHLFLGEELT